MLSSVHYKFSFKANQQGYFGNKLTGAIPSELGRCTAANFDAYGNDLAGPIPTELGLMTNLAYDFARDNEITGTIPTQLSNVDLSSLWIESNELSG